MKKTVSVIVPCYNTVATVCETLDSIISQTYPNLDVILVNDGSKDNLEEVLEPYLLKHANFKYFKQENRGLSAARNSGAKLAIGDYFLFLDADDLIAPTYIEKCVKVLDTQPNVKIAYSHGWLFEAQTGKMKHPKYTLRHLLLENIMPARAIMRKDDFFAVGMYDEELRSCEDWDIWIAILKNGGDVFIIPELLYYYRQRNDKSSLTDYMDKYPEFERQCRQRIIDNHRSVYLKEFGTEIDMLRLIAEQKHIIERYKKKSAKWYRRLLNF